MSTFIEIRCPNRPKNNTFECRHELGGVKSTVIENHDFDKGAFEDIRYCPSCGVMWHIKIEEKGGFPEFNLLPKDKKVDFKNIVKFSEIVSINGNRSKY